MGERAGDPNQPSDGTPADRPHQPRQRADGGAADHGTTPEDRDDVPTPPPALTDEHLGLIDEQPTRRLADYALYCYRLAACPTHDDRDDHATQPDTIPDAYADRIRFMEKRHLRGMAAHSLGLLAADPTGFTLGADTPGDLHPVERRAKRYEWVERRYRDRRLEKTVPAHASITEKQIASGEEPKTYLYWQYRTDSGTTSDYITALSNTPFDTTD